MRKIRSRMLTCLMVVLMVMAMIPTVAFAAEGENPAVDINKTATELKDDKTTVTLTVGADQDKTASDVVFVLDKSTSAKVKAEAIKMLEELKAQADADNDIKVGVVIFNRVGNEVLPLTALTDGNFDEIEKAINTRLNSDK